MFCFRKNELSEEIKGKFYHQDHTMCHQCKNKLGCIEGVTLTYDDGTVYCNECIQKKRKLREQQRQRNEHKSFDDSRNIVGDCIICQKPVVKGGEVCFFNVIVYVECNNVSK